MYKPTLIRQARVEVVTVHPLEHIPEKITIDKELEKLIKRVVKLNEKDVNKEALILTEEEIKKIIRYMPFNDFNVKLDNLFIIYKHRAKLSYAKFLFMAWLESFDNREFNEMAKKYLLNEKFFLKHLESTNLNKDIFLQWLTAENIPYFVGKFTYNSKGEELGITECLEYYGILKTSQLFLECESLFYTYCYKKDYLKCKCSYLYDIVSRYNYDLIKMFLRNFVLKVDVDQLMVYNELMPIITSYTGESEASSKFESFFEDENPLFIKRFTNWLNSYLIVRIFGNDPRGVFWSKFKFVSTPKRIRSNDAVVMKLNGYTAVEFIGTGNKANMALGPVYFYKNEYYKKHIIQWVETSLYDNPTTRTNLFGDWKEDKDYRNKIRYEHHGDWQIRIENEVLKRFGMTKRLYPYRK